MDLLRKILGLKQPDQNEYFRNTERNDFFDESRRQDHPFVRRFDVFTDPLQMHQYFEQEMNAMLKSFGFQEFGQFSTFDSPNMPELHSPDEHRESDGNLRDQFLKPGYVKPKNPSDYIDKDLDEQVTAGNFDSLIEDKPTNKIIQKAPNWHFSGTSQTFKSVTKPNGSVETHKTVRDSQGNEETTVCQRIGDKEYCVIKKRDNKGNEEVTEQFVNMNENEKHIFLEPKKIPSIPDGSNPESNFPWDKFFK